MKTRTGIILLFVSAVSFGAMAIFARMAYAGGVDPVTLLTLRFAIGAIIMAVIVLARRGRWPRGRTLVGLALMGGLGYYGQSLCFFTALTMADAGLVALLLYLYPAIVAVLAAALGRERLTGTRIVAVVVALAGTSLAAGPRFHAQPLGIVLGAGAAVIYSVYILAGNDLLKRAEPLASSTVIMTAAAGVFALTGSVRGFHLPHSASGWIGVAGVAVVCTVIAVTAFLVGLRVVGPTRASVLSTIEPVATVGLAALFLNEPLTGWTVAGAVCVVAATVVLAVAPGAGYASSSSATSSIEY